jgi:hypothetical protein
MRKIFLSIFVTLLIAAPAYGFETIKVSMPRLLVHSQPSLNSPVLGSYAQGQTIQVWGGPHDAFKKLYVKDLSGKNVIGYVTFGAQTISRPRENDQKISRALVKDLRRHWGVSFALGGVYATQGSDTITDASNNQVVTGTLSGFVPEFGAALLIPLSYRFSVDGYIYYKSSQLAGTYALNSTSGTITLTQSFVSFGALGRFYFGNKFWIGPGLQIDYGLGDSAHLNGGTFPLSSSQYIFLYGSLGYDVNLSEKWYVTPQLRLGADINGSPIIMEADIVINLTYRL